VDASASVAGQCIDAAIAVTSSSIGVATIIATYERGDRPSMDRPRPTPIHVTTSATNVHVTTSVSRYATGRPHVFGCEMASEMTAISANPRATTRAPRRAPSVRVGTGSLRTACIKRSRR